MREWLMSAVAEMNMSALVITHDVDEAVSMALQIFVMRKSRTRRCDGNRGRGYRSGLGSTTSEGNLVDARMALIQKPLLWNLS